MTPTEEERAEERKRKTEVMTLQATWKSAQHWIDGIDQIFTEFFGNEFKSRIKPFREEIEHQLKFVGKEISQQEQWTRLYTKREALKARSRKPGIINSEDLDEWIAVIEGITVINNQGVY